MARSSPVRLHRQLRAMAGLEQRLEQSMHEVLGVVDHPEAVAALDELRCSSRRRGTALAHRLHELTGEGVPADDPRPAGPDARVEPGPEAASAALLAALALVDQAIAGYAVLMEVAFRAADSEEHAGPGNTGDLAWDHLRECTRHSHGLLRLLPYVVIDELEGEGSDCRCQCPTCGLGVCGCPLAFRRRLELARREAGPIEDWPGLRLVRPRLGSPAAAAGLGKGDVLVEIDGQPIDSIPGLQEAIRAHPPGTAVTFRRQQAEGGSETVAVVRP